MKDLLSIGVFFIVATTPTLSQTKFSTQDFTNYTDWFNQETAVYNLYSNNSKLYIFTDAAPIYLKPSPDAPIISKLELGSVVHNISFPEESAVPTTKINGYTDIWYHARVSNKNGKAFRGYIWGGHIAKAWSKKDINQDGQAEFFLLGISTVVPKDYSEMGAELRILQNGELAFQHQIPGLCIFDACASDALLKIHFDPQLEGWPIIETTTMANGCSAGIEKAYHFWNGSNIYEVFHAEFTTQHVFTDKTFTVIAKPKASESTIKVKLCQYSHEGKTFQPKWKCKTIETSKTPATAMVTSLNFSSN